jgi:hypothetical protein
MSYQASSLLRPARSKAVSGLSSPRGYVPLTTLRGGIAPVAQRSVRSSVPVSFAGRISLAAARMRCTARSAVRNGRSRSVRAGTLNTRRVPIRGMSGEPTFIAGSMSNGRIGLLPRNMTCSWNRSTGSAPSAEAGLVLGDWQLITTTQPEPSADSCVVAATTASAASKTTPPLSTQRLPTFAASQAGA